MMLIQNVKNLSNDEFLVSYYGYATGIQAKHCKIIDGFVHSLSACEYKWNVLPVDMSKAITDYIK
jgi:hypothetical protein